MKRIGGYNPENNEEHEIIQKVLGLLPQEGISYSLRKGVYRDGEDKIYHIKILASITTPISFNWFGRIIQLPLSSEEIPVFAVETHIEKGHIEKDNSLTKRLEGNTPNLLTDQKYYFVNGEYVQLPEEITNRLSGLGLRQTQNVRYYQ